MGGLFQFPFTGILVCNQFSNDWGLSFSVLLLRLNSKLSSNRIHRTVANPSSFPGIILLRHYGEDPF